MHRELITFEVGGQVFGIDIMAIREIRAWSPATRLPRVPHYVAGARLGWEPTEPTPRHAIIVTQLGAQVCGLIVDSVSDIVTLNNDALQPPPTTANDSIISFLEGLAAIEDRMVMVLNLAALADGDEFGEAA